MAEKASGGDTGPATSGEERPKYPLGKAYRVLVVVNALLAASCGLTPHIAHKNVFGKDLADPVTLTLWRFLAAGFVVITGVAFALERAAAKGTLHMPTARTLNYSVMVHEGMSLLLSLLASPWMRREALLLGSPVFVAAFNIAFWNLKKAAPEALRFDNLKKSTMQAVKSNVRTAAGREGSNLLALVYSVLSMIIALLGVTYILAPKAFLQFAFGTTGPKEAQVITCALGGGFLLPWAVITYALKDAAQRDRLMAAIHKIVNAALAVGSWIQVTSYLLLGKAGAVSLIVVAFWTAAGGFYTSQCLAPAQTSPSSAP